MTSRTASPQLQNKRSKVAKQDKNNLDPGRLVNLNLLAIVKTVKLQMSCCKVTIGAGAYRSLWSPALFSGVYSLVPQLPSLHQHIVSVTT